MEFEKVRDIIVETLGCDAEAACSNDKRGLLLLNFFQYGYLYFHLSAVES